MVNICYNKTISVAKNLSKRWSILQSTVVSDVSRKVSNGFVQSLIIAMYWCGNFVSVHYVCSGHPHDLLTTN